MGIALKKEYSTYFEEMTDSELFTDDEIIVRFSADFGLKIETAKRTYVFWYKLNNL